MFFSWMVLRCIRRPCPICAERVQIARFNLLRHPVAKCAHPYWHRLSPWVPECSRQIMGDGAAADDQHALFAQWAQRTTQGNMPGWILRRLQRQLCDRNIGLRKQKAEWHPRAVIQ